MSFIRIVYSTPMLDKDSQTQRLISISTAIAVISRQHQQLGSLNNLSWDALKHH